MTRGSAALLIFDGDCSFCSSSARWVDARLEGQERAVPWQRLSAEQLDEIGLTSEDVRRAVWWSESGRGSVRGHLAVAQALRATSGWPSLVGRILLVPPFRWLAAAGYPVIARWRHRLPGGTPACRM